MRNQLQPMTASGRSLSGRWVAQTVGQVTTVTVHDGLDVACQPLGGDEPHPPGTAYDLSEVADERAPPPPSDDR